MTRIHLLRPGTFRDMHGNDVSFTAADIASIAKSYDPKLSQAPIVIGHPAVDDPAYGWAASLQADGDELYAETENVDPSFADLVRAGRYRTVSASLYRPDAPGNPKPGQWYLRHIGFLGAQPPAVKGLKQAHLASDGDGVTTLEFAAGSEHDGALWGQFKRWLKTHISADLADVQDRPSAAAHLAKRSEEQEAQHVAETKDLEAREASLAEREAALTTREKSIADTEAAARKTAHAAFAESLVKEGRLIPADKPLVMELLQGLASDGKVELADGSGTKSVSIESATKDWLTRMPKIVPLSEAAKAENAAADIDAEDPVALAEAAGALVTEEAKKGNTIQFAEAVRRVARAKEGSK